MAYEQGYDVLRLIEHSESCYVSSEYVRWQERLRVCTSAGVHLVISM